MTWRLSGGYFSPDMESIPAPPGGPGAQGMINTVAFLDQVVPDLNWEVQEVMALTGAISQLTAAA